jgi:hypothetical protein
MAEGFGSIADLKIVVDANTEKFSNGISLARDTIQRFSGDGVQMLSKLDTALAKIGTTADAVKGKIFFWIGIWEQAKTAITGFEAKFSDAVGKVGKGEEYGKVKTEMMALLNAIGLVNTEIERDGLITAKDAAMALVDSTGLAVTALADLGDEAGQTQDAVSVAIAKVQLLVTSIREAAESYASPSNQARDTLERGLVEVQAKLDEVRKRASDTGVTLKESTVDGATAVEGLADKFWRLDESLGGIINKIRTMGAEMVGLPIDEMQNKVDRTLRRQAELTRSLAALNAKELAEREASYDAYTEELDRVIGSLDTEIKAQERKNATLGMSAAALARHNAELKLKTMLEEEGLELDGDAVERQRDKINQLGSLVQREKDYEAGVKARAKAEREAEQDRKRQAKLGEDTEKLLTNSAREVEMLRAKMAAYGMTADAAARLAFEEKAIAAAQQRGIPLTAELRERVRSLGAAYQEAMIEAEAMKRGYETMAEVGNTVSRNLENGFRSFLTNYSVEWKEFMRNFLIDIQMMAFKMMVLQSLFGKGGSGGGGLFGGLMGGIGSLFGGGSGGTTTGWGASVNAMAEGGNFGAFQPLLVGENGPERIFPTFPGSVVPNQRGAGGEVVVTVLPSSEFDTRIDSRAEGVVARRAPAIAGAAVDQTNKALPSMIADAQRRRM